MRPVGKDILLYKLFTLKVPAIKGLSRNGQIDILSSHTMPRYLNVSV